MLEHFNSTWEAYSQRLASQRRRLACTFQPFRRLSASAAKFLSIRFLEFMESLSSFSEALELPSGYLHTR